MMSSGRYEEIIKKFDEEREDTIKRKRYHALVSKLRDDTYRYEDGDFLYLVEVLDQCPAEAIIKSIGDRSAIARSKAATVFGNMFPVGRLSQDEAVYATYSLVKALMDINYEVRHYVLIALQKACKAGSGDLVRDMVKTLSENGTINIQDVWVKIEDIESIDSFKEIVLGIIQKKQVAQPETREERRSLIEGFLDGVSKGKRLKWLKAWSGVKKKQESLAQEAESKGFGEREADWAPKVVLGDEGGWGSLYVFKSPGMIAKYIEERKKTEKEYEKMLKIIKNLETDQISREGFSSILRVNGSTHMRAEDLKGCHSFQSVAGSIGSRYEEMQRERLIRLFPLCVLVECWDSFKDKLGINDSDGSTTQGVCRYIRALKIYIAFADFYVSATDIHELVHILFGIVEKTENIGGIPADRLFINETLAFRIAGDSFESLEDRLVSIYIPDNELKISSSKYTPQVFEKLIREKLVPVAMYLDKNFPMQFFDIMARARSIDELWGVFGGKVGKLGVLDGISSMYSALKIFLLRNI